MAADSEVADADFAAEQQVNARVPKGMEELVPDMMPETISEGVREITLPNDPVEVDTEAWEADETAGKKRIHRRRMQRIMLNRTSRCR